MAARVGELTRHDRRWGSRVAKAVAWVAASAALTAGIGLAAGPASAVGTQLVDTGDGSIEVTLPSGQLVFFCEATVAVADCDNRSIPTPPYTAVNSYASASGTYTVGSAVNGKQYPALQQGLYTVVIRAISGWALIESALNVQIGDAPVVPVASPEATLVLQGLPMPASGTCADILDADFAWGTGLTGGWQKSWQVWRRDDGTVFHDGWACVRTMVNTGSGWSIQA